jgi:hypothetical protein
MRVMQTYSETFKIPPILRRGLEYAVTLGLALLSSYLIVYARW